MNANIIIVLLTIIFSGIIKLRIRPKKLNRIVPIIPFSYIFSFSLLIRIFLQKISPYTMIINETSMHEKKY